MSAFNLIEFKSNEMTESNLIDSIENVKYDDCALIVRNGLSFFSKEEWPKFVTENCSLELDKRHYDIDSNLNLDDWWEVSYQPDKAISYAYSNTKQPFHSDNAWFQDPSEINFFIMKKQAKKGGEQLVYPVKRLISDLKKENRNLLENLQSTEVEIKKGEGDYSFNGKIITLDPEPIIHWNYYRIIKTNQKVEQMCDSFFKYLSEKENSLSTNRILLNTGDIMFVNDLKILHGRSAFTAEKAFDRILLQSMWKIK